MGVKEADRGIAKYVIVYMNCILKVFSNCVTTIVIVVDVERADFCDVISV